MSPIIKAEHVCFTYEDGHQALNGINLEINKGRKIACMGSNGSGKSTFFLCLNGIHKPQSGTIFFDGKPLNYSKKGLLDLRSKVGIVFQDPDNQLFLTSVYQEISFGILNLGISYDIAKETVEQVIETLEITPFQNKPTHTLSGGQKKQVAIADILVMNPDIMILDEPNAALDPKHTAIVNNIVNQLIANDITVIISTHDVDYAYRWADEIILFHEGRILMQDSPDIIFQNKELLDQTSLEQPMVLQMYHSLCSKGILMDTLSPPRTLAELELHIQRGL